MNRKRTPMTWIKTHREGSGYRLGIGFMGGVVFPACGHLHTGPWNEGAGQHRTFPCGSWGNKAETPPFNGSPRRTRSGTRPWKRSKPFGSAARPGIFCSSLYRSAPSLAASPMTGTCTFCSLCTNQAKAMPKCNFSLTSGRTTPLIPAGISPSGVADSRETGEALAEIFQPLLASG